MKKILWASPNSLLDTASGFALSVREMLLQLVKYGYEVKILSATIFDSQNGMTYLKDIRASKALESGKFVKIKDGALKHITFVSKSTKRQEMLSVEELIWFRQYCNLLDSFKPDIVFSFRDGLLELEMWHQAKQRKIVTVAYLVNPSYNGKRWIRDIDLLITDSIATSKMYKEKNGYNLTPVGKFIPEEKYLAEAHIRKNVLFINPLLAKGALIVIQLAMALEKRRPDIVFEVVESRGNWDSLLKSFTKSIGKQRSSLSNITISKNTNNMKSIYGHTKLLLVPSLWFESAGRVIIEAQVNGIPSIGSSNGGIPEMIGDGGVVVNFPKELYKAPYNKILDKQSIEKITSVIERFYDDKSYYKKYQLQALNNYHNNHNIDKNTKILIDTIER